MLIALLGSRVAMARTAPSHLEMVRSQPCREGALSVCLIHKFAGKDNLVYAPAF